MLADAVALLHDGRVAQFGTPRELFAQPASPWVCQFLGMSNQLPGVVQSPTTVRCALGDLPSRHAADFRVGSAVTLVIPPDAATYADDGLALQVLRRHTLGRLERLELQGPDALQLRLELEPRADNIVRLRFDAQRLFVFARS